LLTGTTLTPSQLAPNGLKLGNLTGTPTSDSSCGKTVCSVILRRRVLVVTDQVFQQLLDAGRVDDWYMLARDDATSVV
jgi:hypothetical protein